MAKRKRSQPKRAQARTPRAQPTSSPSSADGARFHALAAVAIFGLGLAAYATALEGPFVFDDARNIVNNPGVHWTSLSPATFLGVTQTHEPTRAVAYASFGINHYFGGLEVWGYHATNVAIHLLTALLVYALSVMLLRPGGDASAQPRTRWIALSAALFFVLHPLQTQAVTYVVQRMTSLCALFYLASLCGYVYGRQATTSPQRGLGFALALVAWILALGTKQISATLPLAALLVEWFFLQNASVAWLKRNAGYAAAALALLAGAGLLLLGASPFAGLQDEYEHYDFTLGERLLTQPRVVWFHLSQVLLPLPSRLNLLHDVAPSTSLLAPITTLPSLVGILGLVGLAIWVAPRQRILAFAILWLGLHLVIESSVVALDLIFEHRMYLPMVGVCLALAWGVFQVFEGRERIALGVVAAVCALLALGTVQRNQVWQDEIALWRDTVAKSPEIARAHTNLGVAYTKAGRLGEAITKFEDALALRPELERARTNLGNALREQGRREAAITEYRKVLARTPTFVPALLGLAGTLADAGRPVEALVPYGEVARLEPERADARIALGLALQELGRCAEAVPHYEAALAVQPGSLEAHNNLAWVQATCPAPEARNGPAALAHAKRALELAGSGHPAVLDSLSAAHAELGDFDAATKWQREAVARAPATLRGELRQRLALYESEQPFRDTSPAR